MNDLTHLVEKISFLEEMIIDLKKQLEEKNRIINEKDTYIYSITRQIVSAMSQSNYQLACKISAPTPAKTRGKIKNMILSEYMDAPVITCYPVDTVKMDLTIYKKIIKNFIDNKFHLQLSEMIAKVYTKEEKYKQSVWCIDLKNKIFLIKKKTGENDSEWVEDVQGDQFGNFAVTPLLRILKSYITIEIGHVANYEVGTIRKNSNIMENDKYKELDNADITELLTIGSDILDVITNGKLYKMIMEKVGSYFVVEKI